MLPSRGVSCSIQHANFARRRIGAVSARNFSSIRNGTSGGNSVLPGSARSTILRRPLPSKTSGVVLTAATVRFASWSSWNSWPSSTSPTPATNATPVQTPQTTPTTVDETASAATNPLPTPPIPEQQAPVETAADIDIATPLDTLNNFLVNASSVSPDQIGYLQSLGIQYSRFRPTGLMEFVMEHIHVYSGTPWWATIALTAVAVRCVFFIPFVKAAENNTRMQAIMPLTKPLTDKMTAAAKARDQAAVMEHRSAIQQIHRRAGVSILKGFYPALQFFPAMGTFFLIREMAKIPVPELQTGGMLWFKDLSVQDPYFILPIAASAMLHLVLRKGGEAGQSSTMNKDIQKAMMFGLPALSLAFTWWFPAGVQLSFVTASILSYTQVVAFQQPWFRSYFKMTPIAPVVRQTSSSYSYPGARPATSGPVLSQSELNSRFQGADQGQAKDQSLLAEAKQSFQGSVKLARDKMAKSNEDKERKRIEDYELKRQKEIKEEKERRRISKREKRRNV